MFGYLLVEGVDAAHESGGADESVAGQSAGDSAGELLMSVDPDSDETADRDVEVALDREKVHLFDERGDVITHDLLGSGTVDGRAGARGER